MLSPYFPVWLLPLFAVFTPWISQLLGLYKPIALGGLALGVTIAVAFLTPLTGPEVPEQAIILFGYLTAGYTAAKVVGQVPGVGRMTIASLLGVLCLVGLAGADGTGLPAGEAGAVPPPPVADTINVWLGWGMAALYGVLSRLLVGKGKKKR